MNVQKGFFPYMFPYPYTANCIVPLPPKQMYCVDTMKKDRREEFDIWYEEKRKSGEMFDYFSELTTYCSQDVNILRLAANKFQEINSGDRLHRSLCRVLNISSTMFKNLQKTFPEKKTN